MSLSQTTNDERTLAMLCHITGLISFIGPLIVWLLKKDESEFIDANGKQALNFQISIFIYSIVASMLIVILIGIPLLIALGLFSLVMIILASVKALNGEVFEYPLSMKILK